MCLRRPATITVIRIRRIGLQRTLVSSASCGAQGGGGGGKGKDRFRGRDSKRAVDEAFHRVVRELGLTRDQQRQLHDAITGEGETYEGILEIAKAMFGR